MLATQLNDRREARRCLLGLCVALALGALPGCGGGKSGDAQGERAERPVLPPPRADDDRPNVVFIMTDDQEVDSLRVMPKLRRTLTRRGVTFEAAFTGYPLCCPSRATFLSGQLAHNHGVRDNRPPEGGYTRFNSEEALPVWLSRAGYHTAHVGKYMNDYKPEHGIPPGWSTWYGMTEPSARYFRSTLNEEGEINKYDKAPEDYSTDLYTRRALEFIRSDAARERPFYLSIGYVAPHVGKSFLKKGTHCDGNGPEPAPRHLGRFEGEPIPRTPNFNEDDISDKPEEVRSQPKLLGKELHDKTDKYQCRLESLLAVDDAIPQIVRALRETGALENTYVIFMSDNGFVQGQHRIKGGKAVPYEDSIRVPLIVRGPGVPANETSRELVSNADFAATVLDLAEATDEATLPLDGASIVPAWEDPERESGRAIALEAFREPGAFAGVRTARYTYVERTTGEVELYDLRRDPYQLRNLGGDPRYEAQRRALAELTERLRECQGESCEQRPRLRLNLSRTEGPAGRGPCRSGLATAAVVGRDAEGVAAVSLAVGGGTAARRGPEPQLIEVPQRGRPRVDALAEMTDGRVVRLTARLPGCLAP